MKSDYWCHKCIHGTGGAEGSGGWVPIDDLVLNNCFFSASLIVEKEELIFPLSSLVAEFGGTLGLFLGFSFMTLWDHIQLLGYVTLRSGCSKSIFGEQEIQISQSPVTLSVL